MFSLALWKFELPKIWHDIKTIQQNPVGNLYILYYHAIKNYNKMYKDSVKLLNAIVTLIHQGS